MQLINARINKSVEKCILSDTIIPVFTFIWGIVSMDSIVCFLILLRGILSSRNLLKIYAANFIMKTTVHRETNVDFLMIFEINLASTILLGNANIPASHAVFLMRRRSMLVYLAFLTSCWDVRIKIVRTFTAQRIL